MSIMQLRHKKNRWLIQNAAASAHDAPQLSFFASARTYTPPRTNSPVPSSTGLVPSTTGPVLR
jgi:hypothetical protein